MTRVMRNLLGGTRPSIRPYTRHIRILYSVQLSRNAAIITSCRSKRDNDAHKSSVLRLMANGGAQRRDTEEIFDRTAVTNQPVILLRVPLLSRQLKRFLRKNRGRPRQF